jgi:hypothetical protein
MSEKCRILATSLLLARILVGVLIGVVVVIIYVVIDYVGQTDKRLYFIDHRESIETLLSLGVLIGGLVGLVWAFSSKRGSTDGQRGPQT